MMMVAEMVAEKITHLILVADLVAEKTHLVAEVVALPQARTSSFSSTTEDRRSAALLISRGTNQLRR
jgi:hypothetical protein